MTEPPAPPRASRASVKKLRVLDEATGKTRRITEAEVDVLFESDDQQPFPGLKILWDLATFWAKDQPEETDD